MNLKCLRYELSKKFLGFLCAFEFDRLRAQLKWKSPVFVEELPTH